MAFAARMSYSSGSGSGSGSAGAGSSAGPRKPVDIDDLSLQLAISLQLADIDAAMGREGDTATSTDEVAFGLYKELLGFAGQDLGGERRTVKKKKRKSADSAVLSDLDVIAELAQLEIDATSNWDMASRKGKGRGWEQEQEYEGKDLGTGTEDSVFGLRGRGLNRIPPAIPQTKCSACMELTPLFTTISAPCDHTYCYDCIRTLFTNATTDEEQYPPRCCTQEITIDLAWDILSDLEIANFFEKAEEYSSTNRIYCSNTSCNALIPDASVKGDLATCVACNQVTCAMCKRGQHRGDCPEDPDLMATLELGAKSGWMRCKLCHALVELSSGCQHITCRCKAQWCYRCGKDWRTCGHNTYDSKRHDRRVEDLTIRDADVNANTVAPQQKTA
ncbi:hypothetical protein RUND412_005477 [Rhizina undulata]